jgi:hypothetical protein
VAPEKGFTDKDYFEAPFMPYLPFIGIFANWYLVSQLGLYGLATVLLYFILVAILYFYFAKPKADDRLAIWQNVYADMTVQSKEENNSVVEEETSNEKEEHDNDVHPTDAVTE